MIEVQGFLEAASHIPTVAVSPIVAGTAIKGPAAKMMQELNIPASAVAVAEHYQRHYPGLLNGFVIDESDGESLDAIALPTVATQSVMKSLKDRIALAERCLAFFSELPT